MDTNIIIYIVFAVVVFILILWIIQLEKRMRRFFSGKSGANLEMYIINLAHEVETLKIQEETLTRELAETHERAKRSIRDIATKRFNPFSDSGSNQSFAVALTDDHGNGLILSSIYARERMSVYAKPIVNGVAQYELTDEEAEVLQQAQKK